MSLPAKPPNRVEGFFETLFGSADQGQTLVLIADGLLRILDHVGELLVDVECLVQYRRFARARFLIATADEELGKCHLLLDCARLDVHKHRADLKNLSKGFYDHIDKYAYMRLWRLGEPKNYEWWNMDDAFRVFNNDRVRFWKASSSSFDQPPDEPDMPHDTYFAREMNLYVDISETGDWYVTPPSYGSDSFDKDNGMFEVREQTKAHLKAFDALRRNGALAKPALQAANAVWRGTYVNRGAQREQLEVLWRKTAKAVSIVCALTGG